MGDLDAADDPPTPSDPPLARTSGFRLKTWSLLGVLGVAGLFWWAWPERARPRVGPLTVAGTPLPGGSPFIGSATCRHCHPGEHAGHMASGHAGTLRSPERLELASWLDGRRQDDPERPGTSWSYALDRDRLVARRHEEGGRIVSEHTLDIALGSGTHAVTFLTVTPDEPGPPRGLEHRLTYFAHRNSLAVTPGQEGDHEEPGRTPDGFELPARVLLDCLECHGTRTAPPRSGAVDLSTLIPDITCERCHGPGRAHAELAWRGVTDPELLALPFGLERTTADAQIELCGRCHRLPDMVPPGSIRPENAALARFPSVGLLQSACFLQSEGTLSCTTCHDPHARAASAANPYEEACLACHRPTPKDADHAGIPIAAVVCPIEPESGCVRCHMPKRDVGHGLRFSDHWIRAERPNE